MSELLGQSDFENLSAWLDGELLADAAAEVERRVRQDPAWREAADELRDLHEALGHYTVPSPASGLAGRILAGIPTRDLTESEIEELSAYLDGELPAERAAAVDRGFKDDPAWREARLEFEEVDRLLDCYTVPPASAELTGRIKSAVQKHARRRQALRSASWLAPAAAAAAAAIIVVGLAVFSSGWLARPQTPIAAGNGQAPTVTVEPELVRSTAFEAVPVDQRPALQEEIIRHLNFFRDYEVVADFETLQAIERIDSQGRGT